ncbi:hypothetical protein [Hyphomonas sp.]|uniref:hypothetical protein n=1 Tax=Hyphomonas sp. TaxID=87 RepID=UPI0032D8C150
MILRRLTKHVKDQNWFAVALDFLIVVVGVFIGLQVNNWNEARFERMDTRNVLERLERDFELQLTLTNRSIGQQVLVLEATSRLITGIRTGDLDEQTLNEDVALVDSVSAFPGPSAAFQELVSTGRMRLIANGDLRDELYEFDSAVTFGREVFSGSFTAPVDELARVLARAKILVASGTPSETFAQVGAVETVDHTVLLEDPEIHIALQNAYLIQDNYHLILIRYRNQIKDILELLAEERERAS